MPAIGATQIPTAAHGEPTRVRQWWSPSAQKPWRASRVQDTQSFVSHVNRLSRWLRAFASDGLLLSVVEAIEKPRTTCRGPWEGPDLSPRRIRPVESDSAPSRRRRFDEPEPQPGAGTFFRDWFQARRVVTVFYSTFAVDDRPLCVWTGNPDRPDRDFLDALDSEYFAFIGKRLWRLARTRHKGRAALALRASYHHAIETLVALLFAALQAPHCAVGWMHAYRVRDLRSLIRKLDRSERFPSIFSKRRGSWAEASQAIFQFMTLEDSSKRERIVARFGTLWSGSHANLRQRRQSPTTTASSMAFGFDLADSS